MGVPAVVFAGMQLLGGLAEAKARREQAAAEAALLDQNAALADYAAVDAESRSLLRQMVSRAQTRQLVGAQKTRYAAAGVDLSGSAADVVSSTEVAGELDASIERVNGAREAWGFRTQGGQMRYRAELARRGGSTGSTNALLSGVTSAAAAYRTPGGR